MPNNFDKHATKANEFLHQIAVKLGHPDDTVKAERILKAVIHSLRNRLTLEESFQFMAQLPLLIKGIYVDGWNPSKEFVRIKHIDEFIDEVYKEAGNTASADFATETDALKAVSSVFEVLKKHVSTGEIDDLKSILPKELKQLWEEPIFA